MDDRESSVAHQLADLAELKATLRQRRMLRHGTPEWEKAVANEERLIARIGNWVLPGTSSPLTSED